MTGVVETGVVDGGGRPWDAVFIDRDGTVNAAPSGRYVLDPDEVRLLPGAGRAVRCLNEAGVLALVVTNQQAVGLGLLTPGRLAAIHERLTRLLAAEGARVDGIYICPHVEGTCACRKPADGLLRAALSDHPGLDPARCAIVGDSASDLAAGRALAVHGVLLAPRGTGPAGTVVAPDLATAVDALLTQPASTPSPRADVR